METAALTRAQHSSRNAFDTSKDAAQAQKSHEQAAALYAEASSETNDSEALRILSMLERQHNELSRIVKSNIDKPRPPESDDSRKDETQVSLEKQQTVETSSAKERKRTSSPPTYRKTSRDMRSSIASNLATARGIPSVQQRGSGRAETANPKRPTARESLRGNMAGERQTPSPDRGSSQAGPAAQQSGLSTASASSDTAFQKFYTSVEGIFSTLSAPLAYAGLPLSQASSDTPAAQPASASPIQPEPKAQPTASTPDVTRLFSRAALKAVREDSYANRIDDSFAVIPGTRSHAKLHSTEDTHSQYVDAAEHPPSTLRRNLAGAKSPTLGKTFEELEHENKIQRDQINKMSKELYMWQQSSQQQTQQLNASVRMEKHRQRPPERDKRDNDRGKEKEGERKVTELEERVRKLETELKRVTKENKRLNGTVEKYRQRWNELTERAKQRRDGPAGGGDKAAM